MEEAWSVGIWLGQIGLAQYKDVFEANGLTDSGVVAGISEKDLQDIGITVLGHRKKILLEAPKIGGGGGGGGSGGSGGGGSGGGGSARPRVVNLPDAWKLTWDDTRSKPSIAGSIWLQGGKSMWAKQDGEAEIGGVSVGPNSVQLWNFDDVANIKTLPLPSGLGEQIHTSFDVWEAQHTVVTTLSTFHGQGFIILLFNMSGEVKTLRKETAEKQLSCLHILPNGNPVSMVAWQSDKLKLLDANTSRPLSSWPCPAEARSIEHDPLQPNVFYVRETGRIVVYDKNVKNEVRTFRGLDEMKDMKVPCSPGTQLIANNASECKIWDIGTGKVIHSMGGWINGQSSSLLGNIVSITGNNQIKVYDLNDGSSDPAKELSLSNELQIDTYVLPTKIVVMTNCSMWATTAFGA